MKRYEVKDKGKKRKLTLLAFIILLTYDGALRKWGLPVGEQLLFIIKDVLLLFLLGLYFAEKNKDPIVLPRGIGVMLGIYLLWAGLCVFNPILPNMLVGLWGLKAHCLYMGLVVILVWCYDNHEDVIKSLASIYPYIVYPVCFIAFLQLRSGSENALNQQIRTAEYGAALFGEANLVRVSGTFSYIAGMAAFIQSLYVIGVGLYLKGERSRNFLLAFMVVFITLPSVGSRATLVIPLIGTATMLVLAFINGSLNAKTLVRFGIFISIFALVSFLAQESAWTALQQRIVDGKDEGLPRLFTPFTNAFSYFGVAGIWGFGTGATNAGAAALAGDIVPYSWVPVLFEEESGRLVLELGVLGWAISFTLRVMIAWWSIWLALNGRSQSIRTTAVICVPFALIGVYVGSGVFAASYSAVSYWLSIGMLSLAHKEHRLGAKVYMRSMRS